MSYLVFTETENTGKTMKFLVSSNGSVLAQIKWYAPWRRYALFTMNGVLFDSACLKEVISFIDGLMEKRKKVKKE